MSNIWFTSDFHFNHSKDFIYKARGFDSVKEMNKHIIVRYNSSIQPEDTIYILGDIMMGTDYDSIDKILRLLKGHKILIIGNHDTDKRIDFFREGKYFEDIQFGARIKKGKKTFLLTHYPMLIENITKDGVYNLHGHTHSTSIFSDIPKCINVAVDAWNCYPANIDVVNDLIKGGTNNEKQIRH